MTISGLFYWIIEQSDETGSFYHRHVLYRLLSELSLSLTVTSCLLDLLAYMLTAEIIWKNVGPV